MLEWFIYFAFYLGAGFSLKLGDDLLDEAGKDNLAWIPLGLSGLLFGILMSMSEWDFVLLASIVVAVTASGKVNRVQFSVGFLMIFVALLLVGLPAFTAPLDLMTILILLFLAAVLDEKGNDWADKTASPTAAKFFQYRFSLKTLVLLLVIPWPFFLTTALGLWVFDIGYEASAYLSRNRVTQ